MVFVYPEAEGAGRRRWPHSDQLGIKDRSSLVRDRRCRAFSAPPSTRRIAVLVSKTAMRAAVPNGEFGGNHFSTAPKRPRKARTKHGRSVLRRERAAVSVCRKPTLSVFGLASSSPTSKIRSTHSPCPSRFAVTHIKGEFFLRSSLISGQGVNMSGTPRVPFAKQWLSNAAQLQLLQQRE